METLTANGLRIAYLSAGDGPLALLLHGFPDTPHGFAPLVSALAQAGYRVVAPYGRGYAPTEIPERPGTTLEELAEDALGIIEALGGRCRLLVGHDWGAATAYLVATLAPERVDQLVAIGLPHPATLRLTLRLLFGGRHFFTLTLPGAAARLRRDDFKVIDGYYRRWSPTWAIGDAETRPVKDSFSYPGSLEAAIGYYRANRLGRTPDGLRGKVDVPTLAIAGQDDPSLPPSTYEAAARKFRAAYRVEAFPGGHFVHRESPDEVNRAVLVFAGEAEG